MIKNSSTSEAVAAPERLEKGVLSVFNGIALAAAAMAPVTGVVLNAPAAGPGVGAALPLGFVLAFISCLLVGNTVVQFARWLPSSGSYYNFISHGLGSMAGFFTGWLFWMGYTVIVPGLCTALGAFTHDYVLATFNVDTPWWIYSLIGLAIVLVLSITSIKTSVRVDLALLTIEVVFFLALAVVAIVKAGSNNTAAVFLPSASHTGFSGIGIGIVFGIFSFVGFDAAATLGEESRNPRRTVPLAVVGALLSVGIFYVIVSYALTVGYNITNPANLDAFLKDPNPFITLSNRDTPWLTQIISLSSIAGIFSCLLAVHNTSVRVLFSMGRDRILPGVLGRVHRRWYSPYTAIYLQTCLTILIGFPLGFWLGPGATGSYGFTGAIGTAAIVLVYMLSSIALARYALRIGKFNLLLHGILPALGFLALAYPLWSVGQPDQPYPYNLVLPIVVIWIIGGIGLYSYLRARAPEKLAKMGQVLADEDEVQQA